MVDHKTLFTWYNDLNSRTVDLIGDYAGDEIFVIEGDSILLHVFADEKLDFSPGFQLLHATYMVETFLHALLRRKCRFHIAFFANNSRLCIPPDSPSGLGSRYLLAREAIIQHLRRNLQNVTPSVEVKLFNGYLSSEFEAYLASSGAYFFMCHDGASGGTSRLDIVQDDLSESDESSESDGSGDDKDDDAGDDESMPAEEVRSKIGFRSMIHWFICQGYNVALVNTLECRDTKVMAMIVEDSAKRAQKLLASEDTDSNDVDSQSSERHSLDQERPLESLAEPEPQVPGWIFDPGSEQRPSTSRLKELLETSTRSQPNLTCRDYLLVTTVALMCEQGIIKTNAQPRAMLLHAVLLPEYNLHSRAIDSIDSTADQAFLQNFIEMALFVLSSQPWKETFAGFQPAWNCSDLIDGRLFLEILCSLHEREMQHNLVPSACKGYGTLASLVKRLCGLELLLPSTLHNPQFGRKNKYQFELPKGSSISTKVLPFNNPVFGARLQPVRLEVDNEPASSEVNDNSSTMFKELSHWHNHKRPVDPKASTAQSQRLSKFAHRRGQFFMAEMRDYAASLTNAVGGILEPESVFTVPPKGREPKAAKWEKDSNKLGKERPSKAGKPSVRDIAASAQQGKQNEALEKQIQRWTYKRDGFEKDDNLGSRLMKTQQYFSSLPSDKRSMVEAEIFTYLLGTLTEILVAELSTLEKSQTLSIMALLWEVACRISKLKKGVTADIAACVTKTIKSFGLPVATLEIQSQRKLSFQFPSLRSKDGNLGIGMSPMEFQLLYGGPFMDRNMDSAPDARVHDFEPDKWQRDVLDQIDAKHSLFVSAPTSAGKTFISFYAMKQVLQGDDDGVLVYVAPTKALVNQIAAEIQARFSKSYPGKLSGKSVWAIHTRDYRINNPTNCQILVTVPHILQIMLLAPANAKTWASRIKRIIFDEIHCIGQADDGVVWEQLLLLSPCPIIALSATVGNPQEFCNWLSLTQKANGIDLRMIEHKHRYSDLRKYRYQPPLEFSFNGFSNPEILAPLGLDNVPGMAFIHPVASLVDRSRGIPDDLNLEPRDCLTLWNAMKKYQTADFPVDASLDPSYCLPEVIRKADIVRWEANLKSLLKAWIEDRKSPFGMVLEELSQETVSAKRPETLASSGVGENAAPYSIDANNRLDTTLPLICSLHHSGALPALFFNYDRLQCEHICRQLLERFREAEARWKATSRAWKAKVAKWEEWKQDQEKLSKKKNSKKGNIDDETMSAADRIREEASAEFSIYESFDPDGPVDAFHVADTKKLSPSEFDEYAYQLRRRFQPEWLIDALKRGIGVHHAGMNRKYRQVCEVLFRKGFLRVVIATGTLALGINMPCKTVVFSGDSVFLTALNFRQAAGRAGRRGFDMLGNVVFQDVRYTKICRLMSSRLPDLNGHFPITTSLVLRLCILLSESKQAPHAVRSINSILSSPRIYLGGPEMKDTVLHHLRFSIEYLRRNNLLDSAGVPLNFAGSISHLYFTESSSFAFHALLNAGYFHQLVKGIELQPKATLLRMMLVMSHLFGRRPLRQSAFESGQAAPKKSPSIIALPKLPAQAARTLKKHNHKTLETYTAYVKTFIDQHVKDPDCTLPLTGIKCGGDKSPEEVGFAPSSVHPPRVTSAFYALSGHHDRWTSISDLCAMIRSGVWLEEAVVPYVNVGSPSPLNAYLYDFYKHGNVHELQRANGIRKNDIWFLLNDFSMILSTIITSLENFLKLSNTDDDMLDVMGSGSAHEANLDEHLVEDETDINSGTGITPSLPVRSSQDAAAPSKPVKPQKKVVDSWEDDVSDNEAEQGNDDQHVHEDSNFALENDGRIGRKNRKAKASKKQPSKKQASRDKKAQDPGSILTVLKAFKMLRGEFDQKFKAMWA